MKLKGFFGFGDSKSDAKALKRDLTSHPGMRALDALRQGKENDVSGEKPGTAAERALDALRRDGGCWPEPGADAI